MHSLLDVLGGAILGWVTSEFYVVAVPYIETSMANTPQFSLFFVLTIASCLVIGFILPDPAWHGCPCFKDTCRVIGVIIAAPVSRANLCANPLSKIHSVVLPFPNSLIDMFIRILICGATLGTFDLVIHPMLKKTVFYYAPPEKYEKNQDCRLERMSASVYCEVFKFFMIIYLSSNTIPRLVTALSL
ncbi:Long-chain base-1-phosphate phosphatase [Entomophthora muscae]|uniref:Long-chain base-1-phosphate phosphatase n=1 Tax=Entomophthora muscae TaxID=34485 RepID=A0ACC2TER3_9FUNG|nr:Long-chain base-1-phosphate phosphatase [Entomophthora muscae]